LECSKQNSDICDSMRVSKKILVKENKNMNEVNASDLMDETQDQLNNIKEVSDTVY
jgi:hypothetical protein